MILKQEFSLIVTVINRGFSDPVIDIAKAAGAEGATILTGRGTSIHETDTVMGVQIQPEKEVVLILVKKPLRRKVMRAISFKAGLGSEGRGLCFSIPVDEVAGITHLMASLIPIKKIAVNKKSVLPPSIQAVQKVEQTEQKKAKEKIIIKKRKVTTPTKKEVK